MKDDITSKHIKKNSNREEKAKILKNTEKPSAESMLKEVEAMHLELQMKTENLKEMGKKVGLNTDAYFQYMTSIPSTEVINYQQKRKKLLDFVEKNAPKQTPTKGKTTDKLTQEHRSKMRGARQRWIPMQ